ncbi:hypothetical protein V6M93_03170 [Pectobacterium brasiliense]|uniref:hypothetical protein n=1 Tax=Pectobacterium brasiliense TaxID=180957 RepID=UPI002A810C75|nr:hypothetical protein [Pectobacterium brasiliense]MDY4323835.1 hypothetical protein [Pectobacterium brasiliense]
MLRELFRFPQPKYNGLILLEFQAVFLWACGTTVTQECILIAILSTTATTASNVYVTLSCDNDIKVNITLKKLEEVGWADLITPHRTQRADFLAGVGNNEGGGRLTFASRGIAFHINYTADQKTADQKLTLRMLSGGSGEYSCNLI